MISHPLASRQRGSIMLLTLVFGGIFFSLLIALASFVLSQNEAQEYARAKTQAFSIAEAGLDHYRWYLSHFPGDITNGTGVPGPYIENYNDPEAGVTGTYELTIVGNETCGVVQSIDVTSVGVPTDAPGVSSTIRARYAPPSVARSAMILGASTWFVGTIFRGPMHSNGGLRMDNTSNNAPVTSSVSSWNCDSSFGCSPSQSVDGIFGNGNNQNLWDFPTPQASFSAIGASYASLKGIAIASGLYFSRYSMTSQPHRGYHLIFNGDDTVTVKRVNSTTSSVRSFPVNMSSGFTTDYTRVVGESNLGTYTIPSDCGLIFVEDNVWVEGSVSGKVTVVAADVVNAGVAPDAVISNNLVYTALDGSSGLTLVAEHDLLLGAETPNDLTINGIFVAQTGAFGRNWYDGCSNHNGAAYQYRNNLTTLGTVVSFLRQNNYWIIGCNTGQGNWSGYPDDQWNFVFDRQNSIDPPPFTPTTSSQWQFVDWQQL